MGIEGLEKGDRKINWRQVLIVKKLRSLQMPKWETYGLF